MPNELIAVEGLSNREFLERYARAGRVGLCGGVTLIDKAIARATVSNENETLSPWSHAFVFQGQRLDGHHWVIESDLQINRKHIRLGAQENRISKYFDADFYTTLAVLDFDLPEPIVASLMTEGLELVASRVQYSVRELVGTLIALKRPELRAQENVLAREKSMYCSAFVQHVFRIHGKNTTPDDISRTLVPHVAYVLKRDPAPNKLKQLRGKVHRRVHARIEKLKAVRHKSQVAIADKK
jgi:hypothetical protein